MSELTEYGNYNESCCGCSNTIHIPEVSNMTEEESWLIASKWEFDVLGEWYCPDCIVKTWIFEAKMTILARTEEDAKDKFANGSVYFASNAQCYLKRKEI